MLIWKEATTQGDQLETNRRPNKCPHFQENKHKPERNRPKKKTSTFLH